MSSWFLKQRRKASVPAAWTRMIALSVGPVLGPVADGAAPPASANEPPVLPSRGAPSSKPPIELAEPHAIDTPAAAVITNAIPSQRADFIPHSLASGAPA